MARYFDIKITSGTASGPYTVYYNSVNPVTIATITSSSQPATGMTYTSLITGNGVNVFVPDGVTSLILKNENGPTIVKSKNKLSINKKKSLSAFFHC